MLSIIVKEHEETLDKIGGMIAQSSQIPLEKELIISTSKQTDDFLNLYNVDQYPFTVRAVTGSKNAGDSVYRGSLAAKGENLLIMDCHMCYSPKNTLRLIDTLEQNPNTVVTPAVNAVEFPSCKVAPAAFGYGVKFSMSEKNAFEWKWLPKLSDKPYPVPLSCGGALALKKDTFMQLYNHGGIEAAFDFEEERTMRLWRLGYPTLVEPRSEFGHWFKKTMAKRMAANWYKSRAASLYINTLDNTRWDKINSRLTREWGTAWVSTLEDVYRNYTSLRNEMMDYRYNIDENYFVELNI